MPIAMHTYFHLLMSTVSLSGYHSILYSRLEGGCPNFQTVRTKTQPVPQMQTLKYKF